MSSNSVSSAPTRSSVRGPRKDGSRTKAIVAIASGAVLLLGGGTTLAYWSTQATIDGGTVTSGDLNLALTGAPEWTLTSESDQETDISDSLDTTRIVPGDTVTLSQAATLTLEGTNMAARLSVDEGTVPAGFTATVSVDGADPASTLVPADSGTVTVSVAFEFDPDVSTNTRNMVTTPSTLADVNVTLEQVAP